MTPAASSRTLRALVAAAVTTTLAAAALAQGQAAGRLLVLDQDAGYVSATSAGALLNFAPSGPITTDPLIEAAADQGAPFSFVSGLEVSPFDGQAYCTDLGASSTDGSILSVKGGGGGTTTVVAPDPQLPDPFDLAFVTTGAAGRRLVVTDWDADPSSLGPDSVGGLGHGALFWVDESTGALTLLSDGTLHPTLAGVADGDSCFEDPVAVAWSPQRQVLYVADLSADPLGLGYTGAIYAVSPADGRATLVSSGQDFLAVTALAIRPDGSPLVVDGVQADSVVWAIDLANTDPEANYAALTGGTQYALLEGATVDGAGTVWLVDSGEYDQASGTFIVPPRLYTVDPADTNPGTNGRIVNESLALTTPVSIDSVDQIRIDSVTPSVVPPIDSSCGGGAAMDVTIAGAALHAGLAADLGANVTVQSLGLPASGTAGTLLTMRFAPNSPSLTGPVDLMLDDAFGVTATLAGALTFSGSVPGGGPPCSRKGDANCDGIVDGVDLAVVGQHFSLQHCVDAGFLNDADFNDDELIDGQDLAVLATFFGTRP